jgi:3-isopropylmalate dehydrogenase
MLEHFGLLTESKKVITAVEKAIISNVVTVDLKVNSEFGTNEVGDFVANYILNKGDMYFKKDFVQIGQSTIV